MDEDGVEIAGMGDFDRQVQDVALRIGQIVRDHLAGEPRGQERVFVVLNALAIVVGHVIAGADEQRCRQLFDDAVSAHVKMIEEISPSPADDERRVMREESAEHASEGLALAAKVKPILWPVLRGKHSGVMMGALSDLVSRWLVGHHPTLRGNAMWMHISLVWALAQESEKELFPNGLPPDWRDDR